MARTVTHDYFTYISEDGSLVTEDSDLRDMWDYHSITVDGIRWVVNHIEWSNGDLCWWDLVPTQPVDGANKMRIFND
jgi:hypothetical protein